MDLIQDILIDADFDTYKDRDWIDEHAVALYKAINKDIRKPETIGHAVDTLLKLYPRLIGRDDIKKWVKVSERALTKLNIEQRIPKKAPDRIEYLINSQYVIKRADHSTTVITKTKRKRHRLNPRQMFETYLILTMTLYQRNEINLSQDRIDDMLAFARTINSPHHYYKLYQIIAYVLAGQLHTRQALIYGQQAYDYFVKVGDKIEQAFSASALARAYQMEDREQALHWLDIAAELLSKTSFTGQHGYVSLQTANIFVFQAEWDAADQWASQAIKDYQQSDNDYGVMMALHTRAMARAYRGDLIEATVDVNQAMDYFEAEDMNELFIHAALTLAFIEAKQGNSEGAMSRSQNAIKMLDGLDNESSLYPFLKEKADHLINSIDDGEIDGLRPGQKPQD